MSRPSSPPPICVWLFALVAIGSLGGCCPFSCPVGSCFENCPVGGCLDNCPCLPRIDPSGRRCCIWPAATTAAVAPAVTSGNVVAPPVYAGAAPVAAAAAPAATTALSPVDEKLSITPTRLLAPVGSEVILKAGVCSNKGYLRTNRRIEWMIGQEGTGQFVTVGEQGEMDMLRLPWQRPNKFDNSYAVGYTTPYHVCLRRGTDDATDDVQVERGEAWITVTSASEGVSYITASAPESENWEARRSTATVYWVDAQWKLPPPLNLQPGQTGELTTTVTRQTDGAPVEGWLVRYEVLRGESARLGYESGQASEVKTDAQGRATMQISPTDDLPGSAQIKVTVVRPPNSAPMPSPRLEVGGGETVVTWSPTASPVVIDNGPAPSPGAPTTPPVTPPPAPFEPPPRNEPGDTLGETVRGIGPRIELVLRRTTTGPIRVGDPIPVTIEMINTGDEPAQNLRLVAEYDRGLSSPQDTLGKYRLEYPPSRLTDLGPGDSNVVDLDFSAVNAGRSCFRVTVSADRASQAFQQECFQIEQPVASAQPKLRIETALAAIGEVGQTLDYIATVYNDGAAPAENVAVEVLSGPELEAIVGTEGKRVINNGLRWEGQRIPAGGSLRFDVSYRCLASTNAKRASVHTYALVDEEVLVDKLVGVEIRPARQTPPPTPPANQPALEGVISSSANPVQVGQQATLSVAITNRSTSAVNGAQFRLRFPPQLQPQNSAGATINQNALEFPPIPSLPPGETYRTTVTYSAVQQGVADIALDMRLSDGASPATATTRISIAPR
ncbi:NPCBM-associated, NEW3 domain of alpha-galactosidase [Planctomycetes bacterium MalM25]|nr:NPCBM-associated, NEW3 domain of alpha-galactosidase [Planctomycetes bacterium MalM25]